MFKALKNKLHIILWVLTDIVWYSGNSDLTLIMIIPTLLLTGYVLASQKDKREENFVLTSWVLMNIMWLLHEIRDWSILPVFLFMIVGVVFSFLTMRSCLHIQCKKTTSIKNGKG